MITATIYLSTKQPNVITYTTPTEYNINFDEFGSCIVPMVINNVDIKYIIEIGLLKQADNYVKSIWDKSNNSISWERTVVTKELPPLENDEEGKPIPRTQKIFYPSITIKYFNPSDKYTPNPYWHETLVEVQNPDKIFAYTQPILISKYSDFENEDTLSFDSLLSEYVSDLSLLVNKDLTKPGEYNELKDVLTNILRTINKIAGDIPSTDEGSLLYTLKDLLETIREALPNTLINDTLIEVDRLIKYLTSEVDNKDFYWIRSISDKTQEIIESNPIVCPGEYIQLRWSMNVGNNNPDDKLSNTKTNYSGIIERVKFETPLFTGGKILAKHGSGVNTKYDVRIFDKEYYNIAPTDFFDYEVGKWCYLMKVNAQLSGDHQEYGSGDISGAAVSGEETYLLGLVNLARKQFALQELVLNSYLTKSAYGHAEDMSIKKYFSHTGLNGSTEEDRILDAGYLVERTYDTEYTVGENLALGSKNFTLDEIFEGWMNSPGHRANIVHPQYTEIGIALSQLRDNNYYYVQNFGYRSDGINVGLESSYRITPFNFGGNIHYENNMAIHYENDLFIDFATNFEKVFDMTHYVGRINSVDYINDRANVSVQIINTETNITETQNIELPIFYHCTGQPITVGGSNSFKNQDYVLIERPKDDENFDNAYVISHQEGLKECSKGMLISVYYYNDDLEQYIFTYMLWDYISNKYVQEPTNYIVPEDEDFKTSFADFFIESFCDNDPDKFYWEVTEYVTMVRETPVSWSLTGHTRYPVLKVLSWKNIWNTTNLVRTNGNFGTNHLSYTYELLGNSGSNSTLILVTYYTHKDPLLNLTGYPCYSPTIINKIVNNYSLTGHNYTINLKCVNPNTGQTYSYPEEYIDFSESNYETNGSLPTQRWNCIGGGMQDIDVQGIEYSTRTENWENFTPKLGTQYENLTHLYRIFYDNFSPYYTINTISTANGILLNNEFPILLNDKGTVSDIWELKFADEYGNFKVTGNKSGEIGIGNVRFEFKPYNLAVGQAYFTIHPEIFSGYFAKDDIITFQTFSFLDNGSNHYIHETYSYNNSSIRNVTISLVEPSSEHPDLVQYEWNTVIDTKVYSQHTFHNPLDNTDTIINGYKLTRGGHSYAFNMVGCGDATETGGDLPTTNNELSYVDSAFRYHGTYNDNNVIYISQEVIRFRDESGLSVYTTKLKAYSGFFENTSRVTPDQVNYNSELTSAMEALLNKAIPNRKPEDLIQFAYMVML